MQALIKDKKEKLSENLGKLKELRKTIKKLDLLEKKAPTTSIWLNMKKILTFLPGQSHTLSKTFCESCK